MYDVMYVVYSTPNGYLHNGSIAVGLVFLGTRKSRPMYLLPVTKGMNMLGLVPVVASPPT
jgi:hypothetical protein